MKVYVIMGRLSNNSDISYLAGVFSDKKKAIAQKNYLNSVRDTQCEVSEYYIEEREI